MSSPQPLLPAWPREPSHRGGSLAAGLAARLADVQAVYQRSNSFVRIPGPATSVAETSTQGAARELLLRLCRTVGVADNAALLELLADGDCLRAELEQRTGRSALVLWEQVNELVQVGLARHDLSSGRVGLTAAGVALTDLGRQLVADIEASTLAPAALEPTTARQDRR